MAIGKFHGVMIPMTPTGSRVASISTLGRTDANFSPGILSVSPAKKSKMWPARDTSPTASGRVLPSSRASSRPSSSRRARISIDARNRMSCRSCGVVRAQAGKAARAASIAASVWAASAWAYSPTMSLVSDGLTFLETPAPSTHSPAMRFLCRALMIHPDFYAEIVRRASLNQPPTRKIAHQRAGPKRPPLALLARSHPIDEPTELFRSDGDDIVCLMREAHSGLPAVCDGSEHRAEQQDEPVGI